MSERNATLPSRRRTPDGKEVLFPVDGSGLLLIPALNVDHAVAEKDLDILQQCA